MAYRNIEIYVVEPKEATNLVTNPSFELATTGYTAVGASSSIARTATNGYQRRGAYGLDITPTTAAESGVYFGTVALTSGTTYVFSCDVRDVAGQEFNLYIKAADADPVSGLTTWTGDGYWKRKSVTWACTSSENYRLYLTRSAVASTTHFYTDGWQCEAGEETTYLDGDMRGYIRGRNDFYWTGTPHASTSVRTAMTRQGGTLTRLRDYCSISGIMGLGMPTLQNNASEVSGNGSYYQNTKIVERALDISVDFYSQSGGYTTIAANRAAVVAAIQPDNVPANEPLRLYLQLEDSAGEPQSDMAVIDCVYEAGLEQNLDSNAQVLERAVISFKSFDPFIKLDGQAAASLAISSSVADTAYLIYRTKAGVWTSAGTVDGPVYCIVEDANGRIYAGGDYANIGGVTTDNIAYFEDGAWHDMDGGLDDVVRALAVGPNGDIWAGGGALAPGGATSSVAVWDWVSWEAPAVANNPGATVYALAFDGAGNLFIGGSYANAGGVAVNGICYWDGAAYNTMNGGFSSGTIYSIAINNTLVYVGGDAAHVGVQSWDFGTSTAWTDLQDAFTTGYVYSLAVDYAGRLCAAGIVSPGGNDICFFDTWSGASWYSAGTASGYTSTKAARKVYVLPNNHKVLLGNLLRFGLPTAMPRTADYVRLGAGNVYFYPDVDLTIGAKEYINDCLLTKAGQWWLAGTWTETTASACSGITSVTLTGARAYPTFTFTGPGAVISIINHTTGREIHFNELDVLTGETLTLDLRRGQISFTSSWRGNVMRYIKVGSDLDWFLQKGTNSIGVQVTGTDANSTMVMCYNPPYHTFDTVAR